jgi:uncharacterized membrane protein YfcA
VGLAITLGALAGLIMGLTGADGGVLAVPLLVFGGQMTVAQASPGRKTHIPDKKPEEIRSPLHL